MTSLPLPSLSISCNSRAKREWGITWKEKGHFLHVGSFLGNSYVIGTDRKWTRKRKEITVRAERNSKSSHTHRSFPRSHGHSFLRCRPHSLGLPCLV